MIVFESIKWRNILSYGNTWQTIQLPQSSLILITGANGSGKSTILDVLWFALSGKPYRNIVLDNFVNSINKKSAVVELTFRKNSTRYKIVRGLKPKIFEIYKNDEKLDEFSHIKDQQHFFETEILGFNLQAFKQSILLTSRFYQPFLEMTKSEKQKYLESILNVDILRVLKDIVNTKKLKTQSELNELSTKIKLLTDQYKQLRQIKKQQELYYEKKVAEFERQIENLSVKMAQNEQKINEITQTIEQLQAKKSKLFDKLAKLDEKAQKKHVFDATMTKLKNEMLFLEQNEICPYCKQKIQSDYKQQRFELLNEKYKALLEKQAKFEKLLNKISELTQNIKAINDEIVNLQNKKMELETTNKAYEKQIVYIQKEINELTQNFKYNIQINEQDLKNQINEAKQTKVKKTGLLTDYKLLIEILADNGVKKYIFNQYIPFLNEITNKYLALFDSPYRVIIEPDLNVTIKAYGYEHLSYGNLSSGEKLRLDFSILLAFLELTRLRNSINTNLFIVDEVLDSSMDENGLKTIYKLFDMLVKKSNKTILAITHRDNLIENYDLHLHVEKKSFSKITFVS